MGSDGCFEQVEINEVALIPRFMTLQSTTVRTKWLALVRFRRGLVFKAHRLLYHSTLGSRVIKKKKKYALPHQIFSFVFRTRFLNPHCGRPSSPSERTLHFLPTS